MSSEASRSEDPAATVQRYIDAFNSGDVEAMAACFDARATILDGMAPHVWHGPSAARDWYRDVLIEGEHAGAGDYQVAIGPPLHADVTGDVAYVVVPATMRFKVRGQPVTQADAVFTTALRKVGADWRIAAWAWAKGRRVA